MLYFGYCETDITPKEPKPLVGFYRPDNLSRGVERPLIAQAAVWKDEQTCCLITIDSIGFTKELSNELRDRVARWLAIPREQVMVCFSHTHSAPDAGSDRGYFLQVCAGIGSAVSRAAEGMKPVSVGWANGRAKIGVNRRPVSRDTDDRVGILKVCDADTGAPELLILRVAAHGNVLKRDNYLVSPDYFGAVREVVGQRYDCPVMLLQGSAGSTAPRYFRSAETPVDARSPECVRSENALQDMANEILRGIEGEIGSIRPRPSLPARMRSGYLALRSIVPGREEALKVADDAKNLCGIDGTGWLDRVQRLTEAGISEQVEDVEIQYFSIGDWCVCGGPYEFMVGFALETRRRLHDEFFYMNGYTNGCLLYFPTEDEFDRGGYEVFWSMLIYYVYMERVYPFERDSAEKVIRYVTEHRNG